MHFHRSKDVTGGAGALFLAACVVVAVALVARAERVIMQRDWVGPIQVAGDIQVVGEGGDEGSEIVGAASLPTDDNVDRKLRKAQEYLEQKRYDLSITVWQEILNGGEQFMRKRDVVRTENGEYPIFDSVHASIEAQLSLLARNAPQGLKEYRLKADADARELIAQARGKDEERALAEIVHDLEVPEGMGVILRTAGATPSSASRRCRSRPCRRSSRASPRGPAKSSSRA